MLTSNLTEELKEAIGAVADSEGNVERNIMPLVFVSIEINDTETLYYTNAPYNITIDSEEYQSTGSILKIEPIGNLGLVDRDTFSFVLGDFPSGNALFFLKYLFDSNNVLGRSLSLFTKLVDLNNLSLVPGRIGVFTGVISQYVFNIEDETPTLTINCVGPLSKLTQATKRSTTTDSQRNYTEVQKTTGSFSGTDLDSELILAPNDTDITLLRNTVIVTRGASISDIISFLLTDSVVLDTTSVTIPATKYTKTTTPLTYRNLPSSNNSFIAYTYDTCFDRSFDTSNKATILWGGNNGS